MEWAILPLKRYFQMNGRARRKEYWGFTLLLIAVQAVVVLSLGSTDLAGDGNTLWWSHETSRIGDLIGNGLSLATFIPSLTVNSRRLHDIDRSAWWMLLWFLPIIGWIIMLVFLCLDGNKGANRYGPDPKQRDLDEVFS